MAPTLVQRIRTLVNDADRVIWTDDIQIQAVMDAHRTFIDGEPLQWYERQASADDVEWKRARIEVAGMFEAGTASASGTIQNSVGTAVSGWTLANDGWVTWSADQEGTAYWYYGYVYDIYGAAADLLEERITALYEQVDWSSDNMNRRASQKIDHLKVQADRYRQMSVQQGGGLTSVTFMREDLA